MLDSGFIGHFPVGGTILLFVQVRSQNLAVASATGTPTFAVYNPKGFQPDSGSMDAEVSGKTGFWTKSLALNNQSSYQAGETYTVICSYVEGGNNRSSISTFQVI